MSGYIDNRLSKVFGAFGALAFSRFPFAAAFVFFLTLTRLDAKTVTVDDAETDKIIYSPDGWKIGNGCSDCLTNPSTTLVNTWHEGSATSGTTLYFTFNFTGISVEVIYLNFKPVEISYLIDDYRFTASKTTAGPYNGPYNRTLLVEHGLVNRQHTLRVEITSAPATVLLDYIIYDDGSVVASSETGSLASSTSTSPTDDQTMTSIGPIVGGVVAGVAIVGVALIWYLRRRGQKTSQGCIFPILRSRSEANTNTLPPAAQTQERRRGAYNVAVNRVKGQRLNETVEVGLMSTLYESD